MFKNQSVAWSHGTISYRCCGVGHPVVLLHGYLESNDIWGDFAESLSQKCRVICIDTPGHGLSAFTGDVVTMELAADAVRVVLDHVDVRSALVVGHSMGGYVALAFAEFYPERLAGLCLLHSTPNADTEEKKKNRFREIEFIKQGRKELIINNSIPNAFDSERLALLSGAVGRAIEVALATPDTGIIAGLKGMASRRDRNDILARQHVPALLIFGEKDNHIGYPVAMAIKEKHHHCKVVMLSNSGHMGFLEQPDQTTMAIASFLGEVFL